MENIFIITSTINSTVGLVNNFDRYFQTLETIKSIKKQVPEGFIIMIDSSSISLSEKQIKTLTDMVNIFLYIGDAPNIQNLSSVGAKSHGEIEIMLAAFNIIKNMNLPENCRIFKINGRYRLTEKFDITAYNNKNGKYVFKEKIKSWKNDGSYLYVTRIWSFTYNLIDDIIKTFYNMKKDVWYNNLDLEHAIYKNIDQEKTVEMPILGLSGIIAPYGTIESD